jgi:hypothetical protein
MNAYILQELSERITQKPTHKKRHVTIISIFINCAQVTEAKRVPLTMKIPNVHEHRCGWHENKQHKIALIFHQLNLLQHKKRKKKY